MGRLRPFVLNHLHTLPFLSASCLHPVLLLLRHSLRSLYVEGVVKYIP